MNGHGYKKFIDLFLKPFFTSKINECLVDIENYNGKVAESLGPKIVKRSSIKLKPLVPCNNCDFVAKTPGVLKKHKKAEHMSSFNLSKRLMEQKQSTRNNSIVENLMIEVITTTDLTAGSVHVLEEN